MEGLLKMNGFSDTRLIFRFKNESINEYNDAIYNLTGGNESHSTNFETGSNELESSRSNNRQHFTNNDLSLNATETAMDANQETTTLSLP
jgi:hypothetical protein